jgi:hypothetical protein
MAMAAAKSASSDAMFKEKKNGFFGFFQLFAYERANIRVF